jgi:hypothetical protein
MQLSRDVSRARQRLSELSPTIWLLRVGVPGPCEICFLQKLFARVIPPTSRFTPWCTVDVVGNPASPECIRRLPLIAEQPLMPDTQVTTVKSDLP